MEVAVTAKVSNIQTGYSCCQCGGNFDSENDFFRSASVLYGGRGRTIICKECMGDVLNFFIDKYGNVRKAFRRVCMAYDMYYSDSLFDKCVADGEFSLGNYMKKMNLGNFKKKTFDDSLNEGFEFDGKPEAEVEAEIRSKLEGEIREEIKSEFEQKYRNAQPATEPEPEEDIDPKDIERWGPGLSLEDYNNLNSHYNLLKKANPNCDSNQEIFMNELCLTKMLQLRAVREGAPDVFSKMSEQYRKSFEKAGLKTVRDASADDSFDIGSYIEMIEKYTPAEYYKNKNSLYVDFDKIGEYIQRFMLRPLRNLQHGTTDRDYEFYVKDEDSEDGSEE